MIRPTRWFRWYYEAGNCLDCLVYVLRQTYFMSVRFGCDLPGSLALVIMLYAYAGGGLLNVMTTTLTTIMMSTLVLLLIIMLITATLHNATKMPYRASAAQIPMIVTVSNLLNVLTVPLSNAALRWHLLCLHCILHIPPHTY